MKVLKGDEPDRPGQTEALPEPAHKPRKVTITMWDDPKDPLKAHMSFDVDLTDEERAGKIIPKSPSYIKLMQFMNMIRQDLEAKPKIKGRARKKGQKLKLPPTGLVGADGKPLK